MSNEKVQQLAALVKEFDIIDLSRSYEEGMPVWITHPRYFASVWEISLGVTAHFPRKSKWVNTTVPIWIRRAT